jgi:hypothetical protein
VALSQFDYSGAGVQSQYGSIFGVESQFDALESLQHEDHLPDHPENFSLPANDFSATSLNSPNLSNISVEDEPIVQSKKKTRKSRRLSQTSQPEAMPVDPEQKLERIRKRNRSAAEKFRQRQKDLESTLQARIIELSDTQNNLLGERESLQSEVMSLTSQISSHQYLAHSTPLSSPLPPATPGAIPHSFEATYGNLLSTNLEEGTVPKPEMSLSDFPNLPGFVMDGSSLPTSEEFGYSMSSDTMDSDMRSDQN